MTDETKSFITDEVGERIDRRLEFALEDGNLMRAGFNQSNYVEDVELLLAEVTRLHTIIVDNMPSKA